jgi:hypothetical protein
MPYFGNAHFDVAHWDYSSYAMSCDYAVQTLA